MNTRRLLPLSVLLASSIAASSVARADGPASPSPMVEKIRAATAAFRDHKAALAAGYVDTGNCVSNREGAAMGVHFVRPDMLGDGMLDVSTPEILVYEPLPGGRMQLVAVEYIMFDDGDPFTGSPVLEGQLLNYTGAPNRYGLPAYHELHVWAWKRNPMGTFADWHPNVSCDAYAGPSGMGGH